MYWTPVVLELLQVYDNFFGQNQVKSWYLYPNLFKINKFFSRSEIDMDMVAGPPIDYFAEPPFPGKMYITAAVYFKYKKSLFKDIRLSRDQIDY
jgi:hypothetical protein